MTEEKKDIIMGEDEEKQPSKLEILGYIVAIIICLILAFLGI